MSTIPIQDIVRRFYPSELEHEAQGFFILAVGEVCFRCQRILPFEV